MLHVTSDEHRDWSRYPAVRKTLERWNLLPHGSEQEDVFDALGVQVTKLAISSRFPALAVANYLHEHPADLLVVATEGRDGVARWVHGSTAEAMARWSNTMTLFVPAGAPHGVVVPLNGDLTVDRILVPVARAPDATAAMEFAHRLAELAGDGQVTITLLHVGDEASMPELAASDGPGSRFERVCRPGDPVEEIVITAERLGANLIVMPTAGRHGVFEALRGSTTDRVLRRAPCPVLGVPARAI